MRELAFYKYQGLGNDFLIVECDDPGVLTANEAKHLCDRRFGVGADGVLLSLPPTTPSATARMHVINANGSIAEMCGNGLRCVALHTARRQGTEQASFVVDTGAGPRTCKVDDREGRGLVTVDMGIARITGEVSLDVDGEAWNFVLVDVGNPHAVTVRHVTHRAIEMVGRDVARHPQFGPSGVNVNVAFVRDGAIHLVVYERGSGLTLACGTGACATAAVFVANGDFRVNEEIRVELPGGALGITVQEGGHVVMCGPAAHVFSGVIQRRR